METQKRVLGLAGLLFLSWMGFLWLVNTNKIDTTSALIMVWVTTAIIIVSANPEILKSIRRISIGSIMIELREGIVDQQLDRSFLLSDLEPLMPMDKGRLSSLSKLARRAQRYRHQPVRLDVHVSDGRISVPMLYVYLRILNAATQSLYVVFFDVPISRRDKAHIAAANVIGAVNGRQAISILEDYWPGLRVPQATLIEFLNDLESRADSFATDETIGRIYDAVLRGQEDGELTLTGSLVNSLFAQHLSRVQISREASEQDVSQIRRAAENNDELVIVTKDGYFDTLLLTCKVFRRISLLTLRKTA